MVTTKFAYIGFAGSNGNLTPKEQQLFMRGCRFITYNRFARLLRKDNLKALNHALTTRINQDDKAQFAVGRWHNARAVCLLLSNTQHFWIAQPK